MNEITLFEEFVAFADLHPTFDIFSEDAGFSCSIKSKLNHMVIELEDTSKLSEVSTYMEYLLSFFKKKNIPWLAVLVEEGKGILSISSTEGDSRKEILSLFPLIYKNDSFFLENHLYDGEFILEIKKEELLLTKIYGFEVLSNSFVPFQLSIVTAEDAHLFLKNTSEVGTSLDELRSYCNKLMQNKCPALTPYLSLDVKADFDAFLSRSHLFEFCLHDGENVFFTVSGNQEDHQKLAAHFKSVAHEFFLFQSCAHSFLQQVNHFDSFSFSFFGNTISAYFLGNLYDIHFEFEPERKELCLEIYRSESLYKNLSNSTLVFSYTFSSHTVDEYKKAANSFYHTMRFKDLYTENKIFNVTDSHLVKLLFLCTKNRLNYHVDPEILCIDVTEKEIEDRLERWTKEAFGENHPILNHYLEKGCITSSLLKDLGIMIEPNPKKVDSFLLKKIDV